jgi:acyl-CoA reductase-like NAD-dependent aldehyde dehydrogenase
VATKRIFIHSSIYKPFVDAMVAYTKSLKVGPGNEPGIMIRPVQNDMQYQKVLSFLEDTKAHVRVLPLSNCSCFLSPGTKIS